MLLFETSGGVSLSEIKWKLLLWIWIRCYILGIAPLHPLTLTSVFIVLFFNFNFLIIFLHFFNLMDEIES